MSMNLQTAKTLEMTKLDGIKIDWTKTDGSVKEITFTDASGNVVVVGGSYGISVYVPKPFEEVDRHVLVGSFMGLVDVKELFEYEHEAKAKLSDFEAKAGYGNDTGLRIEKVKVKVRDKGDTVNVDDLPF